MIKTLKQALSRTVSVIPPAKSGTSLQPLGKAGVVLQGIGASTSVLRATQRRQGFIARFSALIFVILPTLITAAYLWGYAADQFQVEARFAPRTAESKNLDSIGALVGMPSVASTSDSYLLVDFIRSSDLVQQVDKEMDLRKVFGAKGDWFFRLPEDANADDMLRYWRDVVRVRVEASSQSVVIGVRAFSSGDALKIANLVMQKSELIVNSLSEKARAEALASARREVQLAEDRMRHARDQMRQYRDQSQVMDPRGSVAARQELIGKMEAEVASLNSELRALLGFLNESAPSIVSLRTRISAIQAELAKVKASTRNTETNGAAPNLPSVIQSFENFQTESVFAEKAYVAALAGLERARVDADRNSKYLAVHVRPTDPQSSTYPRRLMLVLSTLVISFMIWGSGWLIYLGIRDHMH